MSPTRLLAFTLLGCAACAANTGPDGSDRRAASTGGDPAVLSFYDDWTDRLDGALVAGGTAVIDYDLDRLPQCFGDSYMGRATWNTHAYVRFDVAPDPVAYPLVGCDDDRCSAPYSVPAEVAIPDDAARMELWFNTAGRSCGSHWDSAYGANYVYEVGAAPDDERDAPAWIGDAVVRISRASDDACDGGAAASDGFLFGTWARQRSTVSNICFQVWQPGVTDYDNPNLWRELDVQIRYRFDPAAPFASSYVDVDRRDGNNARYAWSLRSIDPFSYYDCPDVPTTVDGEYITAEVEYYVTVNGGELRPSDGASFRGTFQDYASSPYRDSYCD
jgi:hypothetical protein